MMQIFKTKNGITLIALIISVIIILILSGVIISSIIKGEGLFSKIKNIVGLYEHSLEEERNKMNEIIGLFNNGSNISIINFNDGRVKLKISAYTTTGGISKIEIYENSVKINDVEYNELNNSVNYEYLSEYIPFYKENQYYAKIISSDGSQATTNIVTVKNENIIKTKEDINELATLVNNGNSFEGKTLKIINNIDLIGTEENRNYIPIGTVANPFKGVLDGQNYTINNLYNKNTIESYQGFFGYIENSEIKNLTIESGNIQGASHCGGFVGKMKNSNIINCKNNMDIQAVNGVVAGIVGEAIHDNNGNYKISNCSNSGNISSTNYINDLNESFTAGISGISYILIENSENTGNIESVYAVVGGISGYSDNSIINSTNNGMVKVSLYNRDYNSEAGGIVGSIANGNITNCINNNFIYAVSYNIAGIAGLSIENVKIEDCNNYGNIESASGMVAGILGSSINSTDIYNCCNYGNIKSNGVVNDFQEAHLGGIVSEAYNSNIINCKNIGNINSKYSAAGGIAGIISNNSKISNSVNIGEVIAENPNKNGDIEMAGIAAYAGYNSIIEFSYNTASLSSVYNTLGGIVAILHESCSVRNCYNTGNISGANQAGPILGANVNNTSTISKCYYLGTTTSGESRSEADMKTSEFINLLGGTDYWKLDTNNLNKGFIRLKWEEDTL